MIGLSVSDRKRVIVVALICAIVMNSVIPIRRAEAFVPVALAAPEVALGAFVGVVAIGAIGMEVFGYTEQSDQAMAYAADTWRWGNAVMKKAVVDSYNAAVAAGDKVMTLSSDVAQYWADSFSTIMSLQNPKTVKLPGNLDYTHISNTSARISAASGYYFILPGAYAATLNASTTSSYNVHYGSSYAKGSPTISRNNTTSYVFSDRAIAAGRDFIFSQFGVTGAVIPAPSVDSFYANDVPKIRDAFPLQLPVPSGQDFVYTPTANPSVDVHMQNDGTLADDAGKVYTPDQVKVKSVPKPRIATDAAGAPIVDAAGVPVVGVPVGAVGVGSAAVPGTLVNVRTGEAIQTKTGDTVANPPLDWASQPTTRINWAPLQMTGSALTRVFPFSIPWDVYAQLKIFDVKPQIPVIKVDVPEFWRAGNFVWHLKFNIDFSMFDPVAIGIRWIGNIAFTVGLALAMRRFMPQ